jgi:hypothetical protein
MIFPGLVAYGLFQLLRHAMPLGEPWVLFGVVAVLCGGTAVVAYRVGRETPFISAVKEDGIRRVAWVAGWIGAAYGVQLSLLVLALLYVVLNYDFLRHPEGPAMMALIIPSTSVARDAFEIGYLGLQQQMGRPVVTFPDGSSFRSWLREEGARTFIWIALLGGSIGAVVGAVASAVPDGTLARLSPLAVATVAGGTVALGAYLQGIGRLSNGIGSFRDLPGRELFRFWWWPGLAFAATYYLVAVGFLRYAAKAALGNAAISIAASVVSAMVLTAYAYHLAGRRREEDRVIAAVPASLLRCPFVMNILRGSGRSPAPAGVAAPELVQRST